MTKGLIGLTVAVLVVILAVVVALHNAPSAASRTHPTPPAHRSPAINTGNPINDELLQMSESDQAAILGEDIDKPCVGERAIYRGMADREAFWTVTCTNGKSWSVEIHPDAKGSATLLECSILEAATGDSCFAKF